MDSYIALSYWDLAAASILVFIDAGLSVIFRLRVHRSLLIAAIRMVVQLALVGVVLTTLFSLASPLWTGLAALGMVLFAGHEAALRQERGLSGWWSYGLGTGCMMVSSVLVTVFALLKFGSPTWVCECVILSKAAIFSDPLNLVYRSTTAGGAVATDETDRIISSDKVVGTTVHNLQGEHLRSVYNLMVDKDFPPGRLRRDVVRRFLGIGES